MNKSEAEFRYASEGYITDDCYPGGRIPRGNYIAIGGQIECEFRDAQCVLRFVDEAWQAVSLGKMNGIIALLAAKCGVPEDDVIVMRADPPQDGDERHRVMFIRETFNGVDWVRLEDGE